MPQHDMVLDNAPGAVFRADANNALLALATLNSGPSAPATPYANMLWADTTALQLKKRNSANTTWVVVGDLDAQNFGLLAQAALRSQSVTAFTSAGTQPTFTVTTGYGALAAGQRMRVSFNAAVTFGAQPTLNRDGLGARNVVQYAENGVKQRGRILNAGQLCDLEYDGTDFVILNPISSALIDLTGYSGADVPLGVGESARYDFTSITSLLLRLATATDQIYRIRYLGGSTANSNNIMTLRANNAVYGTAIVQSDIFYGNLSNGTLAAASGNLTAYRLTLAGNTFMFDAVVHTRTTRKQVNVPLQRSNQPTAQLLGQATNLCSTDAAVWASLGTIDAGGDTITGTITVTREL
jgi:hypothetical protein